MMDRLHSLLFDLDELDKLHTNSDLDVRHREMFLHRLQHEWPRLSTTVRHLVAAVEHPPPLQMAVAYRGPLEHCRQIGRAMVDRWRQSKRKGVVLQLTRNQQSQAPDCDYQVSVGYIGDEQ